MPDPLSFLPFFSYILWSPVGFHFFPSTSVSLAISCEFPHETLDSRTINIKNNIFVPFYRLNRNFHRLIIVIRIISTCFFYVFVSSFFMLLDVVPSQQRGEGSASVLQTESTGENFSDRILSESGRWFMERGGLSTTAVLLKQVGGNFPFVTLGAIYSFGK